MAASTKVRAVGAMLQEMNLDNRIRKYMNCRNTMHENIKKAALNDRGRGVIRKEILHINYSANSKLVQERDLLD